MCIKPNEYLYLSKINEKNIFIPLILVAKSRYDLFNDELALIKAGKMSSFKILHEGNLDVDVVYDLNFSPINQRYVVAVVKLCRYVYKLSYI